MVSARRRFRRRTDPGRALLERAARLGLITPHDVERLDVWAGNLATQTCSGELSASEVQAAIAERVRDDLARRGKA